MKFADPHQIPFRKLPIGKISRTSLSTHEDHKDHKDHADQ
jgi:hypothetical protein